MATSVQEKPAQSITAQKRMGIRTCSEEAALLSSCVAAGRASVVTGDVSVAAVVEAGGERLNADDTTLPRLDSSLRKKEKYKNSGCSTEGFTKFNCVLLKNRCQDKCGSIDVRSAFLYVTLGAADTV